MKSLAIFLPFVALGAFANGHEKPSPPPDPAVPSATASSASSSQASSEAAASSQTSSSASTGDSNSTASSGGNTLSSSNVYKQRKLAPAVLTAATNTTAKCQGEWHVGLSAPGGGLGFGKSRTLRDCALAEAADEEYLKGNLLASIKLRCRISFYKETLGEDCESLLDTQTKEDSSYATKEYVDKAFKASVSK